jgi:hypothetical protein
VGTLLALAAFLALLWFFRDRRTPEEELRDAIRDNDRAYLAAHLPPLTSEESDPEMRYLLLELNGEMREGQATGEWDNERFERLCSEARRLKFTQTTRGPRG